MRPGRFEAWLLAILHRSKLGPALAAPVFVFVALDLAGQLLLRQASGTSAGSGTTWEWAALTIPILAFTAAYALTVIAVGQQIRKAGWLRLLEMQASGEDLRSLPWQDFERVAAAAFARGGWIPELVGRAGPDGGIDLVLRRGKERAVAQCKQRRWKDNPYVTELEVRDFAGALLAEKASRGFFVTSGVFAPEAVAFAEKVPQIELIGSDDLFRMLGRCEKCGSRVTIKNGRYGRFLSCTDWKTCGWSADLPHPA